MKRSETLAGLKQVLLRRRDAIRRELEAELAMLGSNREDPSDDDTYAFDAETESQELQAVEDALARMREGNYGTCDECGQNILLTRLQALPFVTLCINCQRETEKSRNSWFKARDEPKNAHSRAARVPRRSKPAHA